MAMVTDLGYMPELVKSAISAARTGLVLEIQSRSRYAQGRAVSVGGEAARVSRTGHLSNHAVSEYLSDLDGFDAIARYLVLAHVSEENNNPDLVLLSAEEALRRRPAECAFTGELLVAPSTSRSSPLNSSNFLDGVHLKYRSLFKARSVKLYFSW